MQGRATARSSVPATRAASVKTVPEPCQTVGGSLSWPRARAPASGGKCPWPGLSDSGIGLPGEAGAQGPARAGPGFERESTRIGDSDFIPAGPVPLFPQGCPFIPAELLPAGLLLFPPRG